MSRGSVPQRATHYALAPPVNEIALRDEEGVAVFRAPESVDRACLLKPCESCPVDALTIGDEDGEQIVP